MRAFVIIIAVVIACSMSGCGKSKQDQIVGSWKDNSEKEFDSVMTFNKDGSLNADVVLKAESAPDHFKMTGTWKFADGKLTYTIDHSDYKNEKFSGVTDTSTLNSIDDKSLTLTDANGTQRAFVRVN
ncbi:MAG TPA: DUF5004 domain-containing protein [Tepidisphaeraceae bacterium]|jgi:uncharacterized protein (TIGR03066 family)|nr:DUF5004 domain-containing protein [Tepidisphaeraceae bacterium]